MRSVPLLVLALVLVALPAAAATYLYDETLRLVPDGRTVSSVRPLDPSHAYYITVVGEGGYSVRPLLDCGPASRTFLIFTYQATECSLNLRLNGHQIPRRSSHTDTLPAYFYDQISNTYYLKTLDLYVHGNGRPVSFAATHDVTHDLPAVLVRVISTTYQEEQARLQKERERQEEQAREARLVAGTERRRLEREAAERRVREADAEARRQASIASQHAEAAREAELRLQAAGLRARAAEAARGRARAAAVAARHQARAAELARDRARQIFGISVALALSLLFVVSLVCMVTAPARAQARSARIAAQDQAAERAAARAVFVAREQAAAETMQRESWERAERVAARVRVLPARAVEPGPPPGHELLKPGTLFQSSALIPSGERVAVTISGVLSVVRHGVGAHPTHYDAVFAWSEGDAPWEYSRHNFLFFDDYPDPAEPFEPNRLAHEHRFAFEGRGRPLYLFFKVSPFAELSEDSYLFVALTPLSAEAWDALVTAGASTYGPPRPSTAVVRADPQLLAALDDLITRYEAMPHLEAQSYVDDYARKHTDELIRSRESILAEYQALLRNRELVARLQEDHSHILARATWQMRALSVAETLAVQDEERRHASERWQAGIERFRQKLLSRAQVAADDQLALTKLRHELQEQFEAQLALMEIDEDERLEYLNKFLESFEQEDRGQETLPTPYKQV